MDSKTQYKKLNWTESAVFLIINNDGDKGNTYQCFSRCFVVVVGGISQVFRGCFRGISSVFLEGFKFIHVVFSASFRIFFAKKKLTLVYRSHFRYPYKLNWKEMP